MGDYKHDLLKQSTEHFMDTMWSNSLMPLAYKPIRKSDFTAILIHNISTNNYDVNDELYQGIVLMDILDHRGIFHLLDKYCATDDPFQLLRVIHGPRIEIYKDCIGFDITHTDWTTQKVYDNCENCYKHVIGKFRNVYNVTDEPSVTYWVVHVPLCPSGLGVGLGDTRSLTARSVTLVTAVTRIRLSGSSPPSMKMARARGPRTVPHKMYMCFQLSTFRNNKEIDSRGSLRFKGIDQTSFFKISRKHLTAHYKMMYKHYRNKTGLLRIAERQLYEDQIIEKKNNLSKSWVFIKQVMNKNKNCKMCDKWISKKKNLLILKPSHAHLTITLPMLDQLLPPNVRIKEWILVYVLQGGIV